MIEMGKIVTQERGTDDIGTLLKHGRREDTLKDRLDVPGQAGSALHAI